METDLHISERLKKLLPPLTPEERKQLKANIEADGKVRDVLLWWYDGTRNVVIDGMHRWEIVRGTDIPYNTEEMHFASYEEAEIWILNNQLGRRNLLKPSDIRKMVVELYNRLKTKRGGDHTTQSERAKYQNDTLLGDAAQNVAESAHISPATVKRMAARDALEKTLTPAAQLVAKDATDAEVKALSKLEAGGQEQVARAVRTKQAKTITEAIKKTGAKPPESTKGGGKANGKPPKKYSRADWFKRWMQSIGPVCRLVDKIAENIGERKCASQNTVQDHLNVATEEMQDWLKVKK